MRQSPRGYLARGVAQGHLQSIRPRRHPRLPGLSRPVRDQKRHRRFSAEGDAGQPLPEHFPLSFSRDELAVRMGAFLNATEPGATLVLGGSWAEAAQEVSVMTETRVLGVNPGRAVEESETVGLLRVTRELPLAAGSVLGVALDDTPSPEVLSSAINAVRPGGRLVGPMSIEPPADLAVLARDDRHWVGERATEMVPLRRAGTIE